MTTEPLPEVTAPVLISATYLGSCVRLNYDDGSFDLVFVGGEE